MGERVDKWLARHAAASSRSQIQRWLSAGLVLCNQKSVHPKYKVGRGDVIAFGIPKPTALPLKPQATPLDILYEDTHLIVVNKPANMPMHPSAGWPTNCLVHALLAHCQDLSGIGGVLRPGIVHRLDKDTSGVVVCAKSDAAHVNLAQQFENRSVQRSYVAFASGRPRGVHGTIQAPLGRSKTSWRKRAVRQDGKPATTSWRVLKQHQHFVMLQMHLKTGRTHQIRVHLAYMNLPVLADPLYGQKREKGLPISTELQSQIQSLGRQALHAQTLGFTHPGTQQPLQFTTPLPADMQQLWQAILAN